MNAPIIAVTVHEDRAAITRRATLSLAAGQHRITIDDVSAAIADKTLTATAHGVRVLDVRCERHVAPWRDPEGRSETQVAALHAERATLEDSRARALSRVHAETDQINALREVAIAAYQDLATAASRGVATAEATARLAELDRLSASAHQRRVDAQLEAKSVAGVLARLEARIRRAEAEAGEQAARLVIDVIADAATDAVISISYVVPGAAWRPYHRAALARAAGRVDWTTTACVWQATGEDWVDVALTFSLERASLGVDPPELSDDELSARRRPDTISVEARDHEVQSTGLGAQQVLGIDDGGVGVTLSAARATVMSDGMPHRIPVASFTAPTTLSLVAIPMRSPWVHLRARIVNVGSVPLLAGPVDLIMSSGYIGRGEIGFVAAGEKFYLGFGPESDIRVHRSETRDHDEPGVLGGWNVQTVRVAVRISNLGGERRDLEVTERIPISEVDQVDIQVATPEAYLLGIDEQPGGEEVTQVTARAIDDNGLVTWGVELPPFGRRAVTLQYRVRSQRGVAGV
ncbi:MAG: mucoidy inhibitor MuiA family protein [Kofleriaceae bacterium]